MSQNTKLMPDLPMSVPPIDMAAAAWLLDLWRAEIDLAAKVGWISMPVDVSVVTDLDPNPQKKLL